MMSTSLRPDDDGVDGLIVVVTTGTVSVGVVVGVDVVLNTPHSVYNNGSCKYIECVCRCVFNTMIWRRLNIN